MEITEQNLESVLAGGKPVVIDFWATWCGPCKRLAPIIEELAAQYENSVVIGKCDIEENPELTERFGIMTVPTVVFLKNGQMVDSQTGVAGKPVYEQKIKSLL